MSIVVFGSLNMDLVARVERLPQPGETLLGHTFSQVPGGKGANQAVAAARLGAPTTMVGRVGDDDFGVSLCQSLQRAGVSTDLVMVTPGTSGVALITVDRAGENQIVVVPGANGCVDQTDVERLPLAAEKSMVLMQFEIPLMAVQLAAQKAQGHRVIVDPAPARADVPDQFYGLVDILTPNQTEATELTGIRVHDVSTAKAAADALCQRGVPTVIVKLGSQGAVVQSGSDCFYMPAFMVDAVDSVAAGDAFNGGLAVALWEGQSLRSAVEWASAVAALSVMTAGAQPSMPSRQQVQNFLSGR